MWARWKIVKTQLIFSCSKPTKVLNMFNVNFEHISKYFNTVVEFEQVNVSWACALHFSHNRNLPKWFIFSFRVNNKPHNHMFWINSYLLLQDLNISKTFFRLFCFICNHGKNIWDKLLVFVWNEHHGKSLISYFTFLGKTEH